jgi:hypothetical protein
MARVIAYAPRDPEASLYGSWKDAFVGGSYKFLRNGARLLDARTQFHYIATVITPAMAHAQVGAGSAYAYTVQDANGDLHFGPEAPTGKEKNWVETIPGKAWFQLFRIYGPLQAWFDQTWKLNEFEPID